MSKDPDPPSSEDVLFGGRLHYAAAGHEMARLRVSFLAMARRLPTLVGDTARLGWAADRTALVAVAAAEAGQGVAGAAGLLATNQVLLRLFAAVPAPDRVYHALPSLALVAAASAFTAVLAAVSLAATGRLEPKVERTATAQLLRRVIRVELTAAEDPAFRRLVDSAELGATAARRMVAHSVGVINAVISLGASAVVLALLHPALLPLLGLIAVPKGWGTVRSARRSYLSLQAWLDHTRQQNLLASLLTQREAAREVRVHAAGPYLLDHFERMTESSGKEQTRLAHAEAATSLAASVLAGVATALTYTVLALLLVHSAVPLAAAGTAVLAIRNGTANLRLMISQVNHLYEQSLFFLDLRRAAEEAERRAIPSGGAPPPYPAERIVFTNVGYTYPGATRPALDKVNLTIRRGQIVALVGENGSGKTTLAKLLSGLCLPTAGTIHWDGVEVSEADREQIFQQVALVDQDFMRWPFTVHTNIGIGQPWRAADRAGIEKSTAHAGARRLVDGLPQGFDTLVAREFTGGVELSGGQWQRLAIARAHFRAAPLLICDEPTAALDARAEIEAFEQIRALADAGHTIVLITHRLASVRHADIVHVLRDGRLVEQGSPAELLNSGGCFADLHSLQAAQYLKI
ncbi:ABC transporter ATP-binding protein [Streptomyces sp. NPDC050617]|uniref:ABC transporter ATP-binding protein n=1 Tax=Streptomyces sp. NPDC050617 TaxID=3154628 RepID=UPI003447BF33